MRLAGRWAAIVIGMCGQVGCMPEKSVGYVEIKSFPAITTPLYLNTVRISELNNGAALLSHSVGRTTLQYQRNGQFVPICEFEVRKNRIVTVTVSPIERTGRCSVKG
jgi:hypothetical protein